MYLTSSGLMIQGLIRGLLRRPGSGRITYKTITLPIINPLPDIYKAPCLICSAGGNCNTAQIIRNPPFLYSAQDYLPLVVGVGAETRAKEFLGMLDRRPELRANVRAAVLVAERRWNLRLKNGVDVRLPEFGVEQALDQLVVLERDVRLSNRDITAIDLRLADRITVRLSDGALQAREEAAKKKLQKPKGGNA